MITIRIVTGTDFKININTIITNTLPRGLKNKIGRKVGKNLIKLIFILLAIARKYLYNAFYKRDMSISSYKIIPINGKTDKQADQGPTISETLECRGERSKAFTTEPMAARQRRRARKS